MKSLIVALPVVVAWWAYDDYARSRQTKEEWQGKITRVYQERPFWGTSRTSPNRYWEVRTAGGAERTVRIYSRSLWSDAHPGLWTIKRRGDLNPVLVTER